MKKKIRANPDWPYYLLLYPAALFLSILWVSFYGSPLPYLVFYTVLLSLPFWLLYVLIIFLTLRIYQSTPDVFCTKGESVPFEIQLENTGLLPMGELSFEWEERLASYEDVPAHARFSLRPGEKLTLNGNLRCLYAGTYPVGILRIRVNGPFGIAHFRFRMPSELRLCVRPIIEESSDVRKLREALASDRSKAYREDVLPGNDLRRYVPGDRLNRIHWKASARQGELLSRLPGENEIQGVCLLLKAFEAEDLLPLIPPVEAGNQVMRGRVQICLKRSLFDPGLLHHDPGEGLYHQIFRILPAVQESLQVHRQRITVSEHQPVIRRIVTCQELCVKGAVVNLTQNCSHPVI